MNADRLIAHRGWQTHYPENTLIAVEQAILAGARHVEVDIRLNANNKPFLYHDESLSRVSAADVNINDLDSQELSHYSAYEPERLGETFIGTPITPLEELVELAKRHPAVNLYLELKDEPASNDIDTIMNAILPTIMPIKTQVTIISFFLPLLSYVRKHSDIKIGMIISKSHELFSNWLEQWQPDIVFCNIKKIPYGFNFQEYPYPLACYEIADPKKAEKLFAKGLDFVETFAITEMLDA